MTQLLSHTPKELSLEIALEKIGDKIKARQDLPYITVAKQLELLEALSQFALGRFLLERGGLNGYWTHYVVTHPQHNRSSLTPLESFLLEKAPTCLATQERFQIFKREIQKRLTPGAILASVPCGLMGDLLELDFSNLPNISLMGIDLDPEALADAKKLAVHHKLENRCQFFQRDAWALGLHEELDLIANNGLTIYEPDDQKVAHLYREFFVALKPGGELITSFLTPPPIPSMKTEWDLNAVSQKDALLQKIVFSDILDSKWQIFRTEECVRSLLRQAGFQNLKILYDRAHIFPTLIAKK